MLVSARWFYRNLQNNPWLPSTGVYEHLLGVVREAPEPNASAEAVKQIIRAACTKRVGQRSADSGTGPLDQLDQDLLDHVCATIQAAVADGGPAEQSALTTLKQELLPRVNIISRDRCHRTRGIMKALWEPMSQMCGGLLGLFTTDQQSLSRMLKRLELTSDNFSNACLAIKQFDGCPGLKAVFLVGAG